MGEIENALTDHGLGWVQTLYLTKVGIERDEGFLKDWLWSIVKKVADKAEELGIQWNGIYTSLSVRDKRLIYRDYDEMEEDSELEEKDE